MLVSSRSHYARRQTQQGPDGGEPFRAEMRNCCKSRTPRGLAFARNLSNRDDIYVYLACAAFGLEVHNSVNQREEGVVSSAAHVLARMQFGAALANKDVTCKNALATKTLYAASLTF